MDLKYSFVIPAKNSSNTVSETLESIINLKGNFSFEIIVVDNASSDHTKELVLKFAQCKYYYCDQVGRSYARNFGAKFCHGEYILFIDSDVVLSSDWLIHVDKYLKCFDLDMMATAIVPDGDDDSIVDTFRKTYSKWNLGGTSLSFHKRDRILPLVNSAACAVKRRSFLAMGGFSVLHKRNEDFELSMRMFYEGYLLGATSQARSHVYFKPYSCKTSISRGFNYLFRFFQIGFFSLFPRSKLRFDVFAIQKSSDATTGRFSLLLFSSFVLLFYQLGGLLARVTNRRDYSIPAHRNGPKMLRYCFLYNRSQYLLDRNSNVVILDSEPYLFSSFFNCRKVPDELKGLFLNPSKFEIDETHVKKISGLKVFREFDVS